MPMVKFPSVEPSTSSREHALRDTTSSEPPAELAEPVSSAFNEEAAQDIAKRAERAERRRREAERRERTRERVRELADAVRFDTD